MVSSDKSAVRVISSPGDKSVLSAFREMVLPSAKQGRENKNEARTTAKNNLILLKMLLAILL